MNTDDIHRPLYVPDLLVNALNQTPERPFLQLAGGPVLSVGEVRDSTSQFVQALRSLGIDTQLIIYPNETHGIQRPSYQRDRLERYLAWYDKYLKKGATATVAERER